jgi:hypothetical protein
MLHTEPCNLLIACTLIRHLQDLESSLAQSPCQQAPGRTTCCRTISWLTNRTVVALGDERRSCARRDGYDLR